MPAAPHSSARRAHAPRARAPRVHARRVTALVAGIVILAAGVLPSTVGAARADDCGAGAVVVVAGTDDVGANFMVGVKQRYTGLHPNDAPNPNSPYAGSGAYTVIVPDYPTALWPVGSVGYDDDVARGTTATLEAIADYQQRCPGKPVAVTGYSQGARVAGDVLNQVGTSTESVTKDGIVYYRVSANGQEYWIARDQMSGELYSDPRRDGPESGRGIEQSLLGVLPGLTMSGARAGGFGTVPVTSYCYQGDPVCDFPDPLHDPLGVVDRVVGYFTKHGYYVTRMWAPVTDSARWACDATPTDTGYVDCVVAAPSAISQVRNDLVNRARAVVGLPGRDVVDLWTLLPNVNRVFPHANLSDLQKFVTPILALLPQLPELGYGGRLPDLLMLRDIVDGIVGMDPAKISAGVRGIGASTVSIALMPVRFTAHWANALFGSVPTHAPADTTTTDTGTHTDAEAAVLAATGGEAEITSAAENPADDPVQNESHAEAPAESPAEQPETEEPASEETASEEPEAEASESTDGLPSESPAAESPSVESPAAEPSVDE